MKQTADEKHMKERLIGGILRPGLLTLLMFAPAGFTAASPRRLTFNSATHMSLSSYLASGEFCGVVLARPAHTPARSNLRRLIPITAYHTNGETVRIRFDLNRPRAFGPGGQFTMDYGRHRVTGGWNVSGSIVEMGVDMVDGKGHVGEPILIFHPPREAGEPIVIGDFFDGGPQAKITGLLLVNIASYADSVQSYNDKTSGVQIDFEPPIEG